MNKNEHFELDIRDLSDDGAGIGSFNGMTFFVPGALPGDRIEAAVTKLKRRYGYARLVRIISPSSNRITPRCKMAGKCGGCTIAALSYPAQLRIKEKRVRDDLIRIGGFASEDIDKILSPIIGMEDPYRYRNKAQVPVRADRDGHIVTGYFAPHSHRVVECEDCVIGQRFDNEIIDIVRSFMTDAGIEPYDEETGRGLIRHILIRSSRDETEIMVCLVINGRLLPDSDALVAHLSKVHGVKSIVINENTRRDNVIMGDRTYSIYGEPYIEDCLFDLKFRIQAKSFYQVNPMQMAKLYKKVADYADLRGDETVWDIYCGIGTIGLSLAKSAGEVHGVEIIPEAVSDARANAKANGITNAFFTVGAAEDVLPKAHPNVVVVDPPRKGCDEKCLSAIAAAQPLKIIYVSCNPATLARDLAYLCARGYELKAATPIDQFCHSMHTEVVTLIAIK